MTELVIQRLESLGFKWDGTYGWCLEFAIEKVKNHIMNTCNIKKIPNSLQHIAVDMACGEFLKVMKDSKQLTSDNYDFNAVVKSISEGDVSVTYAIGEGCTTDEQKLDALINNLINQDLNCIIRHRKMVW